MAMAVLLAQLLGLDIILGRPKLWNYLFGLSILISSANVNLSSSRSSIISCTYRVQFASMQSAGIHS